MIFGNILEQFKMASLRYGYMLFGMSATFDYPQALADLEPILYGD